MFISNDKLTTDYYMHSTTCTVNVDANMREDYIISEITCCLDNPFIIPYALDMLLISSDLDVDHLIVGSDVVRITIEDNNLDVEDLVTSKMNITNGFGIDVIHASKLCKMNESDIIKLISSYGSVFIGFIHKLPPEILDIINIVKVPKIFFGDELVASPEWNNHHSNILSNAKYRIKSNYNIGRMSMDKKINSAINHMKSKDDGWLFSSAVQIIELDAIDRFNIIDLLSNEDNIITVPSRLYQDVITDIYTSTYGVSADLSTFIPYYLKLPHTFNVGSDEHPNLKTFSAGTKLMIMSIGDTFEGLTRCCISIGDGDNSHVVFGALINTSTYQSSFNNNVIKNNIINNIYDFYTVHITPFRLLPNEFVKYTKCENVYSFMETSELWKGYKTYREAYNIYHLTKSNIVVFKSDMFDYES